MKLIPLLGLFLLLFALLPGQGSMASLAPQDSAKTNVRGELLKAFQSAYAAFLRSKAFPNDRKNIENYDVQFTETAEDITVFFAPRRKPGERPLLGGLTEQGVVVRFVVSKKNYRVVKIEGIR